MADYKAEHLSLLQRKAEVDEVMKTHSGWVDKLRKHAQTNHYMKKAGKCGDIVVTGYLLNQSHALKQQVTLEAVSEIEKAFWFPKQVHVYCDDDELSRGYIVQKTNTATVNLNEFVAELFSAFWSGERFTTKTVELYTTIGGPFPDTFSLLKEVQPGIVSLSKPSL